MIPDQFSNTRFQCNVLHLNIQNISKFGKPKTLLSHLFIYLSESHVEIGDILLCETFLNNDSVHLFELPNCDLTCKNRTTKSKGGVAIYIRDNIQYILRGDNFLTNRNLTQKLGNR